MDANLQHHEADKHKAMADRLNNESIQKRQDADGLRSIGDETNAEVNDKQADKLEADSISERKMVEESSSAAVTMEREADQIAAEIESLDRKKSELKNKRKSIIGF